MIYLEVLQFDLRNTEIHENSCDFLPADSIPAARAEQSAVTTMCDSFEAPAVPEWAQACPAPCRKPSLSAAVCLTMLP